MEYKESLLRLKKFGKKERSTFSYWLNHLKAFNIVARHLGAWKFKYLFHDMEKPWLRLILPYHKVQKIHRRNNRHHPEYRHRDRIDWEALVIDWECSRFTKHEAPLDARQTLEHYVETKAFDDEILELMQTHIPPILKKLNL